MTVTVIGVRFKEAGKIYYFDPTRYVVNVGDKVKKGQVLCIIEAMKLMNEIESEYDGEIVEVCVQNEGVVEYAMPLFKIKSKECISFKSWI